MAVLAGRVGTGLGGMLAVVEVVGWEDTALWVAEGTLVAGTLVAGVGRELQVVVVGTRNIGCGDVGCGDIGCRDVGCRDVGCGDVSCGDVGCG